METLLLQAIILLLTLIISLIAYVWHQHNKLHENISGMLHVMQQGVHAIDIRVTRVEGQYSVSKN